MKNGKHRRTPLRMGIVRKRMITIVLTWILGLSALAA